MLPQPTDTLRGKNKTIYINPNFQKYVPSVMAHINPLFLERHQQMLSKAPNIHMNPAFLEQRLHERQPPTCQKTTSERSTICKSPIISTNDNHNSSQFVHRKIICKSRTRLIREPLQKKSDKINSPKAVAHPPLIRLGNCKLIRRPAFSASKYKLDKRNAVNTIDSSVSSDFRLKNKKPFVGPYALRRTGLLHKKDDFKQNLFKNIPKGNVNKKIEMLNINGLLYKSTRNTLQLKESKAFCKPTSVLKPILKSPLSIYVRGTKYMMDPEKFKLTRVVGTNASPSDENEKLKSTVCRRIDIGGFTYTSTSKNVFTRTTYHLNRAYINNAKQRSLQLLTKHLTKSNVPCPIYQRVGKCVAFERGKCFKVHNKLQVNVCNRFLRGECLNAKCLLSHNVCLSKMPVCKFFLLGVCVRNDCPYLHKKLSDNAEICFDFLRGFCQLAEKCNKRHEFVCPEFERTGKCSSSSSNSSSSSSSSNNCLYCKTKKKRIENNEVIYKKVIKIPAASSIEISQNNEIPNNVVEGIENVRYFNEKSTNAKEMTIKDEQREDCDKERQMMHIDENGKIIRPKLGCLPSYIPLS
uniref:C3H1-type domain-containing protein n=1 Tax=Glossina brevipalpis TaxID=37001 RepID=A0A1A9WTH9_9MUSC